jgi:SAM-dependent methyltransferase
VRIGAVGDDDAWAALADRFADQAYASVKGGVRTYVLHRQLLDHLPPAPGSVLDVGGGAAHQSLPLARLGYDVTLLDPSPAMLDKARARVAAEPADVRRRVRLVAGRGEDAASLVGEERFDGAMCHGVLMYLDDPEPVVRPLCRSVRPGGIVSIMALNARTTAVLPAVERRWDDALAAFDATREIGVLGAETRGDTVESLSATLRANAVEPLAWYGVWLFSDWLDLPVEDTDVAAVAEVELAAARRDPYRQLSRVFHLVGRRA